MPKHPFLDLANLPAWSELSPDLIKSEISNALERSEERLQNIRSLSPQESNFNNSVKALEQAIKYLESCSYREVANWLSTQSARYISHVG